MKMVLSALTLLVFIPSLSFANCTYSILKWNRAILKESQVSNVIKSELALLGYNKFQSLPFNGEDISINIETALTPIGITDSFDQLAAYVVPDRSIEITYYINPTTGCHGSCPQSEEIETLSENYYGHYNSEDAEKDKLRRLLRDIPRCYKL